MTTVTMQDAVTSIIESQIESGNSFSAHTVTQRLRADVNTQKTEIDGLNVDQVPLSDGRIIDTQPIEHHEVRDTVKQVMRDDSRGYVSSVVGGFVAYHHPNKDDAQLRQEFGLPEAADSDDSDDAADEDTSLSSIVGDTASDEDTGGDSGLLKKFGN